MHTLIEPFANESLCVTTETGSEVVKDLSHLIPDEEWEFILPAITAMLDQGLQFVLGGGFAFSAYSDRCRSTKDVDLFVRPCDRQAFIDALSAAGFTDYFDQKEYDRSWIYRGFRDGAIVDVIWEMANHRAEVDEAWLIGGRTVRVHGTEMRVLPLEELVWAKLYVLQRDRTDWTDLLNLLYFVAEEIDWDHMLNRVGPDCELLGGICAVFRWMCPERAAAIPPQVYMRIGLRPESPGCADETGNPFDRVKLLDSRDWFGLPE